MWFVKNPAILLPEMEYSCMKFYNKCSKFYELQNSEDAAFVFGIKFTKNPGQNSQGCKEYFFYFN
jgi:hypothetical protein